jgi:transposase
MARSGPRKIARYGDRFKATAVKLSSLPGVLIQDVAAALDIHPFMLSLWRKHVRDGVIVAKGGIKPTWIFRRYYEIRKYFSSTRYQHLPTSLPG